MDIYLEGYGVRILGNYDRTDVIIAETSEQLDAGNGNRPIRPSYAA